MQFRNEFWFLSNMYPCDVYYKGRRFKNAEAAFQSEKCVNDTDKNAFRLLDGKAAKALGKKVALRSD